METTKAVLAELHTKLLADYRAQLEALPFKPKTREAIIDGFSDGSRAAIHHVCVMLGVEVKS